MPMLQRLLATLLVLPLASACQGPPSGSHAHSGCNAACPGVETAAIVTPGAALRGAMPAEHEPVEPAPSSAAYLCPMHLHIGSDQPGLCPECHMKLVPRAEVLEHDHAH